MKLKTVTLGCKVNQYETEFVREGLAGIGRPGQKIDDELPVPHHSGYVDVEGSDEELVRDHQKITG